jgi:hypothetical protein
MQEVRRAKRVAGSACMRVFVYAGSASRKACYSCDLVQPATIYKYSFYYEE